MVIMVDIPEVDDMTYDLCEVLGSDERDFLIRNNGDQVKISSFKGKKIVAIYLCRLGSEGDTFWCSKRMTPLLVQLYREIGCDHFEVVAVSLGEDEESFNAHLAQMPWLAVPHSDSDAVRSRVVDIIRYPTCDRWDIAIVDKSGKILIKDASDTIRYYGAEAYPFTRRRIRFLNRRDAEARPNQSIASLLGDHLISGPNRDLVPVSQLVGKTVAIFLQNPYPDQDFTDLLVRVYGQLRDRGAEFEVVFVPKGDDRHAEVFHGITKSMPWLALQSRSKHAEKLWFYFLGDPDLPKPRGGTPFVYIIGPDGKTLSADGGVCIRMYGADAFPFTPERLEQLEIEEEQQPPLTLETLLAFHGRDFVIRRDGSRVAVAQLVGKTVMLYYGDSISHKQIESCRGIRAKDDAFEVVCIGLDKKNLDTIEDWMFAVPPRDVREERLRWWFPAVGIPAAILLDSSCRVVSNNCDELICVYGADAYPFTEDHLERLYQRAEAVASSWPQKVEHEIHQHELDRVDCFEFDCDGCYWSKNRWNFWCTHCRGFNLHRDYAFGEDNGQGKPDGRHLMNTFIGNITSMGVNSSSLPTSTLTYHSCDITT